MFGSDAVETKKIKKKYTTTCKSLVTLRKNVLCNSNTNDVDEDDDDDDFVPQRGCLRSLTSVSQTPSNQQNPSLCIQSMSTTLITCSTRKS